MTSRVSSVHATALVVFSACCFGASPILITIATASGAALVDVLLWRYALAAILLAIVSGGVSVVRTPGRRAIPLLVFAGGGQALIAFTSLSSLKYIPAASLTFLFYTYPAWVAVISAIRGTERLTVAKAGALALSLAGLAFMIGTPGAGGLQPMGVALALTSALLYALYIPMIMHFGDGIHPAVTSTYATIGAAVVFAAAGVLQGGLSVSFAPIAWGAIALLALFATVLAFLAFLRGLAVIGPVRTAIVSTIEPFCTATLASIVLGQAFGARTFVGGLLIAAAVVLLQLGQRASPESPAT